MTDWAEEREDVQRRFLEELAKCTADGSGKRQAGVKEPWYHDQEHFGSAFSHITKYLRGELVDPESGAHPLVHAAWRLLAIACSENGNNPHAEESHRLESTRGGTDSTAATTEPDAGSLPAPSTTWCGNIFRPNTALDLVNQKIAALREDVKGL